MATFYRTFGASVPDCGVNDFLNFDAGCPKARPIIDRGSGVKVKGSAKRPFKELMVKFEGYLASRKHIACEECGRIGDLVIVLDMPSSFVLLHTDRSFDYLCECMQIRHHRLETPRATSPEREVLAALRGDSA